MTFQEFTEAEKKDPILAFIGDQVETGLDGTEIVTKAVSIGPSGQLGWETIGKRVDYNREILAAGQGFVQQRVSAYDRELLAADLDGQPDYHPDTGVDVRPVVENPRDATVLSSALIDETGERTGFHTIAIDIDHPVRIRATDTPGHYHLFIDVPMPWEDYKQVITALVEAGVVEEGYGSASIAREGTNVRVPWVHKETDFVDRLAFVEAPDSVTGRDVEIDVVLGANDPQTAQQAKLATPEPGHIEFDPDEYVVEYVDGKGVLRRRKS